MKKTPWFDGSVKPAHVGVYERQPTWGGTHYSKFDGYIWLSFCPTPDQAAKEDGPSDFQRFPWRGLTKEAK